MLTQEDLLGLPLQDALNLLQGYEVSVMQSDANAVLNRKLGEEFCHPRVVRVHVEGNKVSLLYSNFKELSY